MAETVLDENEVEYVFLIEQMNWKRGLKLIQKKVRRQSQRNCSRFMTWRDFSQNYGMS